MIQSGNGIDRSAFSSDVLSNKNTHHISMRLKTHFRYSQKDFNLDTTYSLTQTKGQALEHFLHNREGEDEDAIIGVRGRTTARQTTCTPCASNPDVTLRLI